MSREELYQRALAVIPGGVSSPVRAFNAVGGTPFFVHGERRVDLELLEARPLGRQVAYLRYRVRR